MELNHHTILTIADPGTGKPLSGFAVRTEDDWVTVFAEEDGHLVQIRPYLFESDCEFIDRCQIRPLRGKLSSFLAQQMAKDSAPMPRPGALVSFCLDGGTMRKGRVQACGRPLTILTSSEGDTVSVPHWLVREIDLPESDPALKDWQVLSLTVRPGQARRFYACIGYRGEPVIGFYALTDQQADVVDMGRLRYSTGALVSIHGDNPVHRLTDAISEALGLSADRTLEWVVWDWFHRPFGVDFRSHLQNTVNRELEVML